MADARAATEGGADRLEVVRAVGDGGLTPPLSLVRAIAAETPLPLRVMVRENAGYGTEPAELVALRRAAGEFAAVLRARGAGHGAPASGRAWRGAGDPAIQEMSGIVIGFAAGGELRLEDLSRVLEAAPFVRATFHRAFDTLRDPLRAIDALAAIPQIDRILTSGGNGTPRERCARLREYVARAGPRFTIVAGSRVDDEALSALAHGRCVSEVHVGRAAREGSHPEAPVSADRVRRLRRLAGARVQS